MTPENAKAFERLLAVMSGDYAQLLVRGELIARTDDPAGWRNEMRDKALRTTASAGPSATVGIPVSVATDEIGSIVVV